jgi:hypothetical protein
MNANGRSWSPVLRRGAVFLAILGADLVIAGQALAEEPPKNLTEVIIGGGQPQVVDRCVEVQIGQSRGFDCLNAKLRQDVEKVTPQLNAPPLDARSPDLKTGVINIPGVQQQYGRNFGVSAVPYRPPVPVYSGPVRGR